MTGETHKGDLSLATILPGGDSAVTFFRARKTNLAPRDATLHGRSILFGCLRICQKAKSKPVGFARLGGGNQEEDQVRPAKRLLASADRSTRRPSARARWRKRAAFLIFEGGKPWSTQRI